MRWIKLFEDLRNNYNDNEKHAIWFGVWISNCLISGDLKINKENEFELSINDQDDSKKWIFKNRLLFTEELYDEFLKDERSKY